MNYSKKPTQAEIRNKFWLAVFDTMAKYGINLEDAIDFATDNTSLVSDVNRIFEESIKRKKKRESQKVCE